MKALEVLMLGTSSKKKPPEPEQPQKEPEQPQPEQQQPQVDLDQLSQLNSVLRQFGVGGSFEEKVRLAKEILSINREQTEFYIKSAREFAQLSKELGWPEKPGS